MRFDSHNGNSDDGKTLTHDEVEKTDEMAEMRTGTCCNVK